MQDTHTHTFDNGLTLVAESIPGVESLSMTMLLPAGVVAEPEDQQGVAAVLSEMICRGAGDLGARAHSEALDELGVQRGASVDTWRLRLSASLLAAHLDAALPLLMDMVLKPRLEADSLEPTRDLAVQAIESLDDEPQQRVFVALRERHLDAPLGRSMLGQIDAIEALTIDQVREQHARTFTPTSAILAFAGKIDWPSLRDRVGDQLAAWSGPDVPRPNRTPGVRGYEHLHAESTQVHIGLAYDALPETHPDSVRQRAAVALLSGGMSGRLFTEVREKRGLCYAVHAAYAGHRDDGLVLSYAGTTTARAQETLDVLTGELVRLSEGIERDEFDRAIIGMKSRLVMSGESTGARAGAIASDQAIHGRPRTLVERIAEIDRMTFDALQTWVKANPPAPMTLVTVGPSALSPPQAVGAARVTA